MKSDKNKSDLNIKPLFDNVLVKPLEAQDKTSSGIYLPENAKEKPTKGKVMALGTGGFDDKGNKIQFVVEVGMIVYYKKWGGNEIKVGNEEWQILEQKDILAIVQE
jgi:chaperonin GroES